MPSAFPNHVNVALKSARLRSLTAGNDANKKPIYSFSVQNLFFFSKYFNFTYNVMAPEDRQHGEPLDDGNWTGVIGFLQRGKADVSFQAYPMNPDAPVDYAFPILYPRVTFLTQPPRPVSKKSIILFQPFTDVVWINLLFFTIGFFLLFCSMSGRRRQWIRTLISTFGNLLGQRLSVPLTTRSHVLLFTGWILAITCLIFSFKATFLSFLLVVPTERIRTIPELVAAVSDGSVKCGAFPGKSNINRLKESTDESYQIIYKSIIENAKKVHHSLMLMDTLAVQRTALIAIEQELVANRHMFISKDSFFHDILAFPIRKKFRGKKLLDKTLKRMFETGLIPKMVNDVLFKYALYHDRVNYHMVSRRAATNVTEEKSKKKLALEDLKEAFVMLVVGLSSASLAFLGEISCFAMLKRSQPINNNNDN